ncbi:MAG: PAS domain-containing protein [Alphaproteobacteria bacterium]|nr:MAG: PAS domain-containing protein [Alphaproteobacteria bacterium]
MPWQMFKQAIGDLLGRTDLIPVGPLMPVALSELSEQHPLVRFHALWRQLRPATGGLPLREQFSPADVPDLLPWFTVFERTESPEGADFRVRLHGSEVVALTRRDWTGSCLSEHFRGREFALRINEFERSLETEEASLSRGALPISGISWELARGVFPFASRAAPPQIFLLYAPIRGDEAGA